MTQAIGAVTFLVRDYDEAIDYFTRVLRFSLSQDTPLSGSKRWVVVVPPGSNGPGLVLVRAETPEEIARVGDQAAGRAFLFLHTDDFWRDYEDMRTKGVVFYEEPRNEPYGLVVIFKDLYGNYWDLKGPVPQVWPLRPGGPN
ncbi:VOC family protein [Microvirga flavescens]|uniref:VOC family protein n=1 Tax=Microvirga flavescens TaxID=2249811 RepID=UPI000DD5913C|nr:VOC family protein [Microvirga flavescens]